MESEFFPSVAAIRKAIEQINAESSEMTGAYREYHGASTKEREEIEAYDETPEAEEQRQQWKATVAKIAGRVTA
jgi:hypothetical protein